MSTTPADQPDPTLPVDENHDFSSADAESPADETPAPERAAADAAATDEGDDEVPPTLTSFPDAAHPVVLDRETLRRAPRFGRFALVAVLGGLVLGVVLGYVIFPASHPGWSRTIFAFEVMLVTLALTLLAALASDWRSRRPRRR